MDEQVKIEEDHRAENINKARELNRLGCNLIDEGDLDTAEQHLIESIRLTPNLAEPHTNLGVLHCWEGEFYEAIALHLKARQLAPNHSAPHTNHIWR